MRTAVAERSGVYRSRSRGLWRKGATSGATQELLRVDLDCDRDALRFTVRQAGTGFCHRGTWTCFGAAAGLTALENTVRARMVDAPAAATRAGCSTNRTLLGKKLVEEAAELAEAGSPGDVLWEAADVLYFAAVRMAAAGVSFGDVARELDRRALRVARRGGDAKPSAEDRR